MALSSLQTLLYSVEDGIATITLHRPDKLNAFTTQMRDELIAAFDRDRRRRRGTCRHRHRLGPRLLRRRRFVQRRQDLRLRLAQRIGARGAACRRCLPRRRRPGHAAHLQEPEARDRRHQRRGGGHRHDDAAADGHAPGQHRRALRLRLRAARHHARGGVELVPAPAGGHADGAGVVLHRPCLRSAGGAGPRPGAQPARAGRAAAGGARAGPRDRRQHRARSRWR